MTNACIRVLHASSVMLNIIYIYIYIYIYILYCFVNSYFVAQSMTFVKDTWYLA